MQISHQFHATTNSRANIATVVVGTGDGDSNPCTIGHYCPEGSGEPVPCPAGKYGNQEKLEAYPQCQDCPANTYQNLPGKDACKPCGSSAEAAVGQPACTCKGANRFELIYKYECEDFCLMDGRHHCPISGDYFVSSLFFAELFNQRQEPVCVTVDTSTMMKQILNKWTQMVHRIVSKL